MNFLAHMYLSFDDEHLMMGNFIADFIGNKEVKTLPVAYKNGIKLHRAIDSYTDKHPMVSKANKLYRKDHGKYAPVVTDILFDYVLSNHWSIYSDQPLITYIDFCHRVLDDHKTAAPPSRQAMITRMLEKEFLKNYTHLEGLMFTFEKVEIRTKFDSNLLHALDSLDENIEELTACFKLFFPDLIAHCRAQVASFD